MTHGSRPAYQAGCHCLPCKAAEAAYRRALYALRAKRQPSLGHLVSAAPLAKQVKALRVEGFSYAEIARRLGIPSQRIFFIYRDQVRLRTLLRVRRLYRQILLEGPDAV